MELIETTETEIAQIVSQAIRITEQTRLLLLDLATTGGHKEQVGLALALWEEAIRHQAKLALFLGWPPDLENEPEAQDGP